MKSANLVIFNTAVLYGQLIVGMAFGLITTRIVLDALGETDYGIYMLVAGVVGMLNILNSNMSNTSMRYMAHSLGSGNIDITLKTFNTTLFLHYIIGCFVVIVMIIGGLLMFEYLLNVPIEKTTDAKIIFLFMIATTFITVISVPYDAVINSHENILALSVVDTFGIVLKLVAALCLLYFDNNLLILYGLSMLIIQVILRAIKQIYSKVKYDECKTRFRKYVDLKMMKSIISFTSWNLFGSVAALAGTQVRGLLINMFFGVKLNAAEGISKSAGSHVNMVSTSLSRAINPQLMKSEGSGNRHRMLRITEIGTKFSSFLFALFAIPILLETSTLLSFWLKTVPEYSVIFCQLLIITMLIEKFTFQITHAIRAIGDIKKFQVTETIVLLFNIPLAYIIFKSGYSPSSIYIIGIFLTILLFFVRLYFGNKIAGIKPKTFLRNAVKPVVLPMLISLIFGIIPIFIFNASIWRLLIVSSIFVGFFSFSFWFYGLTTNEKYKIKNLSLSALKKVKLIIQIQ